MAVINNNSGGYRARSERPLGSIQNTGNQYCFSDTYETLLSITNTSGKLLEIVNNETGTETIIVRVTIDGNVIAEDIEVVSQGGTFSLPYGVTHDLVFDTSLLVEMRYDTNNVNGVEATAVTYDKD